jgi:hypothetical protein
MNMNELSDITLFKAESAILGRNIRPSAGTPGKPCSLAYALKGLNTLETDFILLTYRQDSRNLNRMISQLSALVLKQVPGARANPARTNRQLELALLAWLRPIRADSKRTREGGLSDQLGVRIFKLLTEINNTSICKIVNNMG